MAAEEVSYRAEVEVRLCKFALTIALVKLLDQSFDADLGKLHQSFGHTMSFYSMSLSLSLNKYVER